MSMDEDGWLVGGRYKTFDYSRKMPYIDSSRTELIRIGSMDTYKGGTSIDQVYEAMSEVSFAPFDVHPEYLKGGGGHHSGNDEDDGLVPSSDVSLIVFIVCDYTDYGTTARTNSGLMMRLMPYQTLEENRVCTTTIQIHMLV
mmetsp:Transcript_64511/g.76387  ORF Transcript_64511/g.76387 Transcript_64511/m.76387 type:complete len:142 (+) Transcript_64511:3-428(+)